LGEGGSCDGADDIGVAPGLASDQHETDHTWFLDAMPQQLSGPVVLVWDYVACYIIPVLCPVMLYGHRWLASCVSGNERLGAPQPTT
jgi:hypothetical protein